MTHKNFEDVHGVGPVGGSRKLDLDGGTRPTFKAIEKSSGKVITVDEITFDEKLHERLPGSAS